MREIPVRELQLMKLEVLKIIDEICRQEKITYYLAYGTLIGAVREKGFVPWDQDIDLMMMRSEYDKFNAVAGKYLQQEKYFLQNYDTEKNMIAPITRICIKGTCRVPRALEHLTYEKGTFVDIFPIDYSYESRYEIQYSKCRRIYNSILFRETKSQSSSFIKKKVRNFLSALGKAVPIRYSKKRLIKVMTQNDKGREVLVDFAGEYGADKEAFNPEWFSAVVYLDFEDGRFPCPIGYDALLTKIYGNYMVRPPVGKRKLEAPSFYID